MTSVLSNHPLGRTYGVLENSSRGRLYRIPYVGFSALSFPSGRSVLGQGSYFSVDNGTCGRARNCGQVYSATVDDSADPDDSEDRNRKDESSSTKPGRDNDASFREGLERIVGTDDSAFSGIDLATLIRNKYGRSYDVQLIKKEFMGRNLLALNVMWKYVEQRSFPLTEEEYILRLDDVANSLKCWGAVSHIRNSLAKTKERPRMGKAVSIFIDMDESGGRANEWIYK
ncbi:hypothetical protein MKW94_027647 [Papaver nudicaule]|uniref:Uncharacterized protein n=1 Tax=Papaver nudicaule TaxID=74823 RepID=A0AA42B0H2_PAPNU|nr:hypothetical protein [Papaver nudicaule]MCL7046725.1 hypothetical protein [Papaver nudicaule]MCL7048043.1 hypothetical protein [Papaver nudicaule]